MSTAQSVMTLTDLKNDTRALLSENIIYEDTSPDSLTLQTFADDDFTNAINYAVKLYSEATGATYFERDCALDRFGYATIPTDYIDVVRVVYPSLGDDYNIPKRNTLPYYRVSLESYVERASYTGSVEPYTFTPVSPLVITVTITRYNSHNDPIKVYLSWCESDANNGYVVGIDADSSTDDPHTNRSHGNPYDRPYITITDTGATYTFDLYIWYTGITGTSGYIKCVDDSGGEVLSNQFVLNIGA